MLNQPARPLISFDWAMKSILRQKANFDVLEGFLTALLGQEIKVLSILESESNQENASDKFNRVDLVVEDEDESLFIVEIQNDRERHYRQRLLYGTSKLIVDHIQLGDDFDRVRKVVSISILYFALGADESDYIYHGTTEFYGIHDRKPLQLRPERRKALMNPEVEVRDNGANIFPEYYLIELARFPDKVQSEIDEWVYFFKNSRILDEFRSKNIQQAKAKLDLLQMPITERRAYERYMINRAIEKDQSETARIDAEDKGFQKGLEKGLEKGVETVARNMLNAGLDVGLISRLTGLSESEIAQLKSENKRP